MDLFSLQNKVAIVTGATGLLGRQHCAVLSEKGVKLVVADLDGESSQAFASELGPEHIAVPLDVTSKSSVKAVLASALRAFDRVDILVNNAAINDRVEDGAAGEGPLTFETYPESLWDQSLSVNVKGTFLCSQVFGTQMVKQGKGSIVNVASTYGVCAPDPKLYQDSSGQPFFHKSAAYSASKGAVISFTRYLAAYWGQTGVRVNCLTPGGVENGQSESFIQAYSDKTPLGRMAEPKDYQGALVFLASEASAYMTGANLVVDGGWTIW